MDTAARLFSLRNRAIAALLLATTVCLPLSAYAQRLGEVDVTYRDRFGSLSTATFGTEPNGSGPNLAQGDIWSSYLDNTSPDGSSGNAIIVTPVVDPILDLITVMRNDTSEVWTEFYFTLPDVPGIGFFNYQNPNPPFNTPTTGGRFSDFEFLLPNGTLADDGTGNSRQLYREIRFYSTQPGFTGILPGENNVFRWVAFFPDPPPSGPVPYPTAVRPNGIPEPSATALGLSVLLPLAVVRLRRRKRSA
jgi:hypothetical protein